MSEQKQSERKQQILQTAIEMIADEGYAALSMRALARASGMKLGALQYHFRTSEDMFRAVVAHIDECYQQSFAALTQNDSASLREIVLFILDDDAGESIVSDKLWPQLWAMQQVEPLVSDLVEDIYASYVAVLEEALVATGSTAPRADALLLISMLEGSTIFMGTGRRWAADAATARARILQFIDTRFGAK